MLINTYEMYQGDVEFFTRLLFIDLPNTRLKPQEFEVQLKRALSFLEEKQHVAHACYEALMHVSRRGEAFKKTTESPELDYMHHNLLLNYLNAMRNHAGMREPVYFPPKKKNKTLDDFVGAQAMFMHNMLVLSARLKAYQIPFPANQHLAPQVENDQAKLRIYLELIHDLILQYDALNFMPGQSTASFCDFYRQPQNKANFDAYIATQEKLRVLALGMQEADFSDALDEALTVPQQNILFSTACLKKIDTAFAYTSAQKAADLEARTIAYYRQYPDVASPSVDDPLAEAKTKRQAIMCGLLRLNLNTPVEAVNSEASQIKRDEITHIDTFLNTVLLDGFPEYFTSSPEGTLKAKNSRLKATIEKALGLNKPVALNPQHFDIGALDILAKEGSPLWTVLKTMKPVSRNYSLEDRMQAYKHAIDCITEKKLGHAENVSLGLNVARAMIHLRHAYHETPLTRAETQYFASILGKLEAWEAQDKSRYTKARSAEKTLSRACRTLAGIHDDIEAPYETTHPEKTKSIFPDWFVNIFSWFFTKSADSDKTEKDKDTKPHDLRDSLDSDESSEFDLGFDDYDDDEDSSMSNDLTHYQNLLKNYQHRLYKTRLNRKEYKVLMKEIQETLNEIELWYNEAHDYFIEDDENKVSLLIKSMKTLLEEASPKTTPKNTQSRFFHAHNKHDDTSSDNDSKNDYRV